MRNIKLLTTGILAVAAALSLAGCKNSGAELEDIAQETSYERHPITLKKGAVNLEVPSSRALSPANKDKVLRFAQSAHSNRASQVIVSRPAGSGSGHAVASQVEDILMSGGVPPEAIVGQTHGGGSVVVSYTRTYAVTKECGEWDSNLAESSDNGQYANFGCAQQQNIAAMVANPEDLALPETVTPSDAMRRSQVFTDYRTPKSPSTPADEQAKATISEVAK